MTIDREQAFALLVDSTPSFAAAGGFGHYVSVFEDADEPDPFVRVGALAHHAIELVNRRDVEEVGWLLDAVERVLAEGDAEATELAVLGLLEPLRNIVSHPDVTVSAADMASLLGPDATVAWKENEELWEAAARWGREGHRFGPGDYDSVTNAELRRYLQAHKRRMSEGELLGASDVVHYQQQVQGLSPLLPAGGPRLPGPSWIVVVVILVLLVGLALAFVLR